jgi:hypothetical protein
MKNKPDPALFQISYLSNGIKTKDTQISSDYPFKSDWGTVWLCTVPKVMDDFIVNNEM